MTEQVGDDSRSHVTGAKVGSMTAPLKPHELATMARIRNKDNQLAERLRSHGWRCVPPEQVEKEEEPTTEPTTSARSAGQIAYEAYCASTDGKSAITGAPLLPWGGQQPTIQVAWQDAAEEVLRIAMAGSNDLARQCADLRDELATERARAALAREQAGEAEGHRTVLSVVAEEAEKLSDALDKWVRVRWAGAPQVKQEAWGAVVTAGVDLRTWLGRLRAGEEA